MKRKAIRKDEYLAAALACLLPQDERDAMRRAKVPAEEVLRMFSPDHIGLHCFDAPDRDEWHNLTPIRRPAHKEKSRRDASIAAKVKRLMPRPAPAEPAREVSRPKRRIAARPSPWPPKGARKLRSRPWPSRSP